MVLVGAGARARDWLVPICDSGRLHLIATVARCGESIAPEVARYHTVDEALAAVDPQTAFAVALPPRAATAAALQLAAAGRIAVVEAPLHDIPPGVLREPASRAVRVAHGWVTLAGRAVVERALARLGGGRLAVDIAGLPESELGEADECLVHGLALVRSLVAEPTVADAAVCDDGLRVDLESDHCKVALRLRRRGNSIAVHADTNAGHLTWEWRDGHEFVAVGDRVLLARRRVPSGAVRALAQLLPEAKIGDDLVEAVAVQRLKHAVGARCAIPPSARPLRQSVSIARRRPTDVLARLGLAGELPADGGPPPQPLVVELPAEPAELWAFRAGLKPVVFLTVRPEEVEATLSQFGEVHCERRDRRVSVGAQDCWLDRRDVGEMRVELYLSRDLDLAQRAARLQAEGDPTASLREMGELVGYPRCCVAAFAAQDDRANNSLNRYYSRARTPAAVEHGSAHWAWELNNLHTMVAPFYPCTYRCEAALDWARRALAELRRAHLASYDSLYSALRRPVLYFDHDHQFVLRGFTVGNWTEYDSVARFGMGSTSMAPLGAAIALGDRLCFDDAALVVERAGRRVLQLERTDPALGFVAPFGDGPT